MPFYSEKYVAPGSERFVNKIWCLDNFQNAEPKRGNQLLPNGCFNIGIVVGKGLQVHFPSKTYVIKEGVYMCSQVTQKTIVDIDPFTKIIFVQLHAWTFSFFPQYDLSGFSNSIIRIRPNPLLPLFSEYFQSKEPENILETTDKLCEELNQENLKETLVELICGRIRAEDATVSRVLKDIGGSVRSSQIKFKKATGLTIKQYSKILSLRKSIDQIKDSQNQTNFAKLALENGYFDQAHYIKTFKEIVKLTPKEFEPKSFLLSYKDNAEI